MKSTKNPTIFSGGSVKKEIIFGLVFLLMIGLVSALPVNDTGTYVTTSGSSVFFEDDFNRADVTSSPLGNGWVQTDPYVYISDNTLKAYGYQNNEGEWENADAVNGTPTEVHFKVKHHANNENKPLRIILYDSDNKGVIYFGFQYIDESHQAHASMYDFSADTPTYSTYLQTFPEDVWYDVNITNIDYDSKTFSFSINGDSVVDDVIFNPSSSGTNIEVVKGIKGSTAPQQTYFWVDDFVVKTEQTGVQIYGAFNDTTTFDKVVIDTNCSSSSSINISRNSTSFEPLSGTFEHIFDTADYGFYLRVNTDDCDYFNVTVSQSISKPIMGDVTYQDTSGDSTFYFGESMDYFKINFTDADDTSGTLIAYISVLDPEGVIKIDNQSMNYTTDLLLDAVGNWSYSIYVTDTDNLTSWSNGTFNVIAEQLSTGGRIYGYDYETLPNYSLINSNIDTYDYYVSEIRINKSTSWSEVSTLIQQMKNESQIAILTYWTDLSDTNADYIYLDNFSDLIDADHFNAMRHIKLYVEATESTASSLEINNLSKRIFQQINNKLPIFIRNYNQSDLDNNYISVDNYIYLTADTDSSLLSQEVAYMRNNTDRSRIYYDLAQDQKLEAYSLQTNIISKMRSGINITTAYTNPDVVELNNKDIIIFNDDPIPKDYSLNPIGVTLPNAYILTNKELATGTPTNEINFSVGAETPIIIYMVNLTKIIIEDDGDVFLFGKQDRSFDVSEDYMGASGNAFLFDSSSANPDDGRIIFTDPSYQDADFYVWYGTAGSEAIGDWSVYDLVIVADSTNPSWVGSRANETELYGYTSVNTYGNNNYPLGCTAGVDCTDWNRTYWIETKSDKIDTWTNIQNNVNIFIDGLDIGEVNDIDGLFSSALIYLSDYVENSKQRKLILNTYTSYENYANLGTYTMRESACGRWDGSVNTPTYSYEDINLEITRANFHKTHGIPVVAQIFGDITDYEKSYYCYMQTKVLYGDLALVGYNQPKFEYTSATDDFQWNYYKYPVLGDEIEEEYTTIGLDSYRRKFENGIVTVNTTSKTVEFTNNEQISNMELCGYYYDNDDGATDEGYMHFVINDDLSKSFNVTDSDLTAFVKTNKCVDIPLDLYEPSGFYEMEFYYLDSDGDYTTNSGLYMYHGSITGNNRLSFWEQTLNDHPSNDETDYWYFATGDNWALNFSINRLNDESAIDDLSSLITHNENGTEKITVTVTSDKDYNLPIYDKEVILHKDVFNGIYVGNTELNVDTTNCDSNSPTYASTIIGDDVWYACSYQKYIGQHNIKLIIPHLSEQQYVVDGNTRPVVSNKDVSLSSLSNGNQNWLVSYDVYDADDNNISYCGYEVNNVYHNVSPVLGVCSYNINYVLNSSSREVSMFAYDSYGDISSNNLTFSLATINFDRYTTTDTENNLLNQYFDKYYNITQNNGAFTNITFSYDGLTSRNIDVSDGTTNDYLIYVTDLVDYTNYDYVPDANNSYTVNGEEIVYRYFNITGNFDVPEFNISLDARLYSSSGQIKKGCGSYVDYDNFTEGNTFNLVVESINDTETQCYELIYNATIIYDDKTLLNYIDGATTNYYFTDEENLGYGSEISSMFSDFAIQPHNLTYPILKSSLTNWADKISWNANLFSKDTNLNQSDYTYVEDSTYLTFNWETISSIETTYLNLTWITGLVEEEFTGGEDSSGSGTVTVTDYGTGGTTTATIVEEQQEPVININTEYTGLEIDVQNIPETVRATQTIKLDVDIKYDNELTDYDIFNAYIYDKDNFLKKTLSDNIAKQSDGKYILETSFSNLNEGEYYLLIQVTLNGKTEIYKDTFIVVDNVVLSKLDSFNMKEKIGLATLIGAFTLLLMIGLTSISYSKQ